MTEYHTDPSRLEEARFRFDTALRAAELRAATEAAPGLARPSPSILWAYASGDIAWPDPDLERAFAETPALRAAFKRLMAAATTHRLPRARAAASDGLPSREGDTCRLRLEPSRAEPGQVFLIVELRDPDAAGDGPLNLTLCDAEDNMLRLELPEPRNGVSQMILQRESEAARWLADPRTEAFLG